MVYLASAQQSLLGSQMEQKNRPHFSRRTPTIKAWRCVEEEEEGKRGESGGHRTRLGILQKTYHYSFLHWLIYAVFKHQAYACTYIYYLRSKVLKDAFVKDGANFSGRPSLFVHESCWGKGQIISDGESNIQARKFIMSCLRQSKILTVRSWKSKLKVQSSEAQISPSYCTRKT